MKEIIDPVKPLVSQGNGEACVEGALGAMIVPDSSGGQGLNAPTVVIAPVITKSQQDYIEKRKQKMLEDKERESNQGKLP